MVNFDWKNIPGLLKVIKSDKNAELQSLYNKRNALEEERIALTNSLLNQLGEDQAARAKYYTIMTDISSTNRDIWNILDYFYESPKYHDVLREFIYKAGLANVSDVITPTMAYRYQNVTGYDGKGVGDHPDTTAEETAFAIFMYMLARTHGLDNNFYKGKEERLEDLVPISQVEHSVSVLFDYFENHCLDLETSSIKFNHSDFEDHFNSIKQPRLAAHSLIAPYAMYYYFLMQGIKPLDDKFFPSVGNLDPVKVSIGNEHIHVSETAKSIEEKFEEANAKFN